MASSNFACLNDSLPISLHLSEVAMLNSRTRGFRFRGSEFTVEAKVHSDTDRKNKVRRKVGWSHDLFAKPYASVLIYNRTSPQSMDWAT